MADARAAPPKELTTTGAAMSTSILFIHGRGRNTDQQGWMDPLRECIRAAGHTPPPLEGGEFLTVSYRDLLDDYSSLPEMAMPEVTLGELDTVARDDFLMRAEALREQYPQPQQVITAQQLADVLAAGTVRAIPLAHLPIQDRGLVELVMKVMGDVETYRGHGTLRAHVLRRVLEQVPDDGELIIIGHSLGSVVALDLLSFLPRDLRVPLFLTLGSPLAYRAIREIGLPGQTPPLPFPHQRVARWVNLVDTLDSVTGFCGLRTWWPEAVDVDVDNPRGQRHSSRAYLSQPAAGEVVGAARQVAHSVTPHRQDLTARLTADPSEDHTLVEIALHYARCLLESEDDSETRERARHARDRLLQMASEATGRTLTIDGCEAATHSWRDRVDHLDRRLLLSQLAFSSPFEPFDPGISSTASRRALTRMATELRVPDAQETVKDLLSIIDKARAAIVPKSNKRFIKPALMGIGTIGLIAFAAPAAVGLFAAAGAGGAAALTSGLAGLGVGGMAGGIGVVGGVGAGGGLLAAQLTRSGTDDQAVAANLVVVGATIRWLRRWGDDGLSRAAAVAADSLPRLKSEYERQLAFHEGYSAPDAEPVTNLKNSIAQTRRLIRWLEEKLDGDIGHRQLGTNPTSEAEGA